MENKDGASLKCQNSIRMPEQCSPQSEKTENAVEESCDTGSLLGALPVSSLTETPQYSGTESDIDGHGLEQDVRFPGEAELVAAIQEDFGDVSNYTNEADALLYEDVQGDSLEASLKDECYASSSDLVQISVSDDEDTVEKSGDTEKSGLYIPGYSGLLHKWQHPGYVFFSGEHEKEISPKVERLLKLIIVGDATVGKTSFVQRYVNDIFKTNYKGTIGVDFALKCLWKSETEMIKLQLWDIAGQERFTWMTRAYYRDAHGCIVMFDLTSNSSFINALKWKQDIDSKCQLPDGSQLPAMLVGNKCDLPHRAVNQDEIELVFKTHNYLAWTEVSAKNNLMVTESINFLVDAMTQRGLGEVVMKHNYEDEDPALSTNRKNKKSWRCC